MIDLKECEEWLKNKSFKKICLQIPEYLITQSIEIVTCLQKYTNAFMFIIGDTSYDNCCSDKLNVYKIEADACIHFGHSCLNCFTDVPTFNIFQKQYLDINLLCKNLYEYFPDDTQEILLFYDVSFAHIIEDVYRELKIKYHKLILSRLNCTSNILSTIHSKCSHITILGRQYDLPSDREIESYDAIFLGPNDKTLITLSMSIAVNAWFYFDGLKLCKYNISNSLWLKRRNFLVEKIKNTKTFGIVLASLNVENYLKILNMMQFILKQMNKKTYVFNVGRISPIKLANFHQVDIFVFITCPESSLIDSRDYWKPIVTPFEIDLAFNDGRKFSLLHVIDFKQLLPEGLNYKKFEVTSKTDVSLLCGNVINFDKNDLNLANNVITKKNRRELANDQSSFSFLNLKKWNGLELKLGEDKVAKVENGRNGIPINYRNELV